MKPPPAQEILESELGEPILARWHVGLGWTLAWTSDVKNLWAVEWLRWPGYGQFWGQLVREHMRQKRRQELGMRAELDTATGRVRASVDAIGGDDKFENGLGGRLEVRGPEGGGGTPETRKLEMRQTAPGRYESDFPLDRYGAFLLHASLERTVVDPQGQEHAVSVAESFGHVTNPYPREYLALQPDVAALTRVAEVTGGRVNPAPRDPFDPSASRSAFMRISGPASSARPSWSSSSTCSCAGSGCSIASARRGRRSRSDRRGPEAPLIPRRRAAMSATPPPPSRHPSKTGQVIPSGTTASRAPAKDSRERPRPRLDAPLQSDADHIHDLS